MILSHLHLNELILSHGELLSVLCELLFQLVDFLPLLHVS